MKLPFGLGDMYSRTITGSSDTKYRWNVGWRRKDKTELRVHVFYRGDEDEDPHDHPWDFWTFPLTSYEEEVWLPTETHGVFTYKKQTVKAFRWHYRPATYLHRVVPWEGSRKIVTLIVASAPFRQWGFWKLVKGYCESDDSTLTQVRGFVYWRDYLNSK